MTAAAGSTSGPAPGSTSGPAPGSTSGPAPGPASGPAPGPFDQPAGEQAQAPTHLVLRNTRAEHSLWPAHTPAPEGWLVVHGPASYEECAAAIECAAVAA
ncbi:MbtH family NRPS accessory protein [Streptomyces sp. LHD-70]|uniref:MbtH family NRPS accessory protein n=1 Tax=Streptomyces sp. LHD-70 TaxID=3072140 RepID=UPI00280ED208|nr:MbtH family NRPS accessory protein [Streptomyces sp. LHD-70]MDQ8703724.1 MbtH family NRPS accessory protein [Streptomyces sp. LHD-70]